jgi:hypothetical protein
VGTLSGKVIDQDQSPIAGARVWVNAWDDEALLQRTLAEDRTDALGRFRLGPVKPVYRHRFDVFIDAGGFARGYVPGGTYSVHAGSDADLGSIRLNRGRKWAKIIIVESDGDHSRVEVEFPP